MNLDRRRALTARIRQRYRSWLQSGEEISYPRCFWQQLGICSALFLTIALLKQVEAPPVQAALSTVRSVATTEMEWDETIGKLEFVGNFVPESVMVFWNAGESTLLPPFAQAVLLDVEEDWALFEGGGAVQCGAEGRVTKVEKTQQGYDLTIACDNGLTAQMQGLQSVHVEENDRVHEGQSLGTVQKIGDSGRLCMQVTEGRRVLSPKQWLR